MGFNNPCFSLIICLLRLIQCICTDLSVEWGLIFDFNNCLFFFAGRGAIIIILKEIFKYIFFIWNCSLSNKNMCTRFLTQSIRDFLKHTCFGSNCLSWYHLSLFLDIFCGNSFSGWPMNFKVYCSILGHLFKTFFTKTRIIKAPLT